MCTLHCMVCSCLYQDNEHTTRLPGGLEASVSSSAWHVFHCRKSILSDKPSFRQSAWQQISPEGKAFVQKLLNKYVSPTLTYQITCLKAALQWDEAFLWLWPSECSRYAPCASARSCIITELFIIFQWSIPFLKQPFLWRHKPKAILTPGAGCTLLWASADCIDKAQCGMSPSMHSLVHFALSKVHSVHTFERAGLNEWPSMPSHSSSQTCSFSVCALRPMLCSEARRSHCIVRIIIIIIIKLLAECTVSWNRRAQECSMARAASSAATYNFPALAASLLHALNGHLALCAGIQTRGSQHAMH